MQILIADDDPISRRLAMHALTGCGADVAVAEDGHAAWAQIQERTQSTVLILDRMMPGIDGVDLCRGARLLPSFPPLYILMVTSASETSDVTAGLDAPRAGLGRDLPPQPHAHLAVLGRRDEAVEAFRQAIRLKPDFGKAYFNLGRVLLARGERDAAVEQYVILQNLDQDWAEKLYGLIYP